MLTTEQEIKLEKLKRNIAKWEDEKVKQELINTCQQMMLKDNEFKAKIAKQWGLK